MTEQMLVCFSYFGHLHSIQHSICSTLVISNLLWRISNQQPKEKFNRDTILLFDNVKTCIQTVKKVIRLWVLMARSKISIHTVCTSRRVLWRGSDTRPEYMGRKTSRASEHSLFQDLAARSWGQCSGRGPSIWPYSGVASHTNTAEVSREISGAVIKW